MKQAKKLTACLLGSLIFLTFIALSLALANTQTIASSEPYITSDVHKAIKENGTARVIVMFSKELSKQDINAMLEEEGISLKAITQSLNIYAGTINVEQLRLLSSMPYVRSIELDKVIMPARFQGLQTTQAQEQEPVLSTLSTFQAQSQEQNQDYYPLGMIQAYDAWNLQVRGVNLSGDGVTVCLIDTGVNYSHPELGGCTTEQFLAGNCPTVIGGYDFANNDPDPMDDCGWGTYDAALIINTNFSVSSDAKIVAMKTLNCDGGKTEWMYSAIDWCINHSKEYNISIILTESENVIGTDDPEECATLEEPIYYELEASALENGIIIIDVAGDTPWNGLPEVKSPACSPNVLGVGAVDEYDNVYFLRGHLLDLLAPGMNIVSIYGDSYLATNSTANSAALTTGAAALLQHFSQLVYGRLLSPYDLYEALKHSSVIVYDPVTQLSFPRLNIMDSITYIAPNATLQLKQGWNLISLPLQPINASPLSVFKDCIEQGNYINNNLFRLDPGHGYDKWTPENNYELETGQAYWLFIQHECNASYKGVPGSTSIELRQGWNFVGFPADDLNFSMIYWPNVTVSNGTTMMSIRQAAAAGWLQPTLYYFDNGYKAVSLDSDDEQYIEPGRGYWILSFKDGLELMW